MTQTFGVTWNLALVAGLLLPLAAVQRQIGKCD